MSWTFILGAIGAVLGGICAHFMLQPEEGKYEMLLGSEARSRRAQRRTLQEIVGTFGAMMVVGFVLGVAFGQKMDVLSLSTPETPRETLTTPGDKSD